MLIVLSVLRLERYLVVIFTGWVLAVALESPVRALQRRRLKRALAVIITVSALLVAGGLLTALVFPSFIMQAGDLLAQLPNTVRTAVENYSALRNESEIAISF